MKKQLVAAVLASLTLSVAAPALAAANPFVDVPAKHWAYDAVTKLAAAGIVDGYGDGTFRGDKTMTRYEMAQIVAKAMTKSGTASTADKALVDKLAKEFNDELKSLGVRVAALEAATKPAVTWSGSVRFQSTQDVDSDSDALTNKLRLRLAGKAQVNDDTTVGFRFKTENDMNVVGEEEWKAKLDHLYVKTTLGSVNVTAGRYDYWLGQGGLNGDNMVTGLQVAKGKFTAVAGHEWSGDTDFYGVSYAGIPIGAAKLGFVYVSDSQDADIASIYGADLMFDLGKIGVTAQYSQNTKPAGDPDGFRLDAKLNKHFNVGYQSIEGGAINDAGTTLDVGSNSKGWDATYNNDWAKNVNFELKYWDMEDEATGLLDDQTLRARLVFKF
jgi:hypothetical protein